MNLTNKRKKICEDCNYFTNAFEIYHKKFLAKCNQCGCFMFLKWKMPKEICPIGKW